MFATLFREDVICDLGGGMCWFEVESISSMVLVVQVQLGMT